MAFERPMLGWQNRVADGAVTAGSELTTRPVANLQNDQGAERWQTAGALTAAGGAYFDIDAGSAVTWRAFGVFRTNLTTAATLRVLLGTTKGASDVYDSGTVSGVAVGYGQLIHAAASDQTARYCRIQVDDAANPDGNIQIGLAYAGPVWQPAIGLQFGAQQGRDSDRDEVVTKGGQEFPSFNFARRWWGIELVTTDEAEAHEQIAELDRIAGLGGNALLIPMPGGAYQQRQAVFGRLAQSSPISLPQFDFYRWSGRFEERL